jgi:hypothetical protein
MINIHSTIPTAPFVTMFHSQCYLVATVIHVQFYAVIRVYVCTHIVHSIETLVGQKKFKKWDKRMPRAKEVSACHFGHACHRFASPDLRVLRILNSFFIITFIMYVYFLSLKMLALTVLRRIYFPLLTVVYTTMVPCVTRRIWP